MNLLKKANIAFLLFCVIYFSYDFIAPYVAVKTWGNEYKLSMFNCDNSMREHFIAKKAIELNASINNIKNLQSTELGLLHCHEYDKLRKKLLGYGLTSNDLSKLGLETMEEKSYELSEFVKIHEFKY